MKRTIVAYLSAVLVTYLLGSIAATQVILTELQYMGMPVTLYDRVLTSLHDLAGLSLTYLPALLVAMGLGFSVGLLLGKLLPRLRGFMYPLFGSLAVLGLHFGSRELLGYTALAAARHDVGLWMQVGIGWAGGYAFLMFLGLARYAPGTRPWQIPE